MRTRNVNITRKLKLTGLVLVITGIIASFWNMSPINAYKSDPNQDLHYIKHSLSTQQIMEQVLDAKIEEFRQDGYFSEYYHPSIHATYYAVQSLMYLGKEIAIDKDNVVNFIMAHYNATTHLFSDIYSDRYLDTDFLSIYYPLTSLLEVNCYATIILYLLGNLSLIDTQDTINFIWSCYNPLEHGFMGRPYDPSLASEFLIPTAENTFHAVMTLDLLLSDWLTYGDEVDDIILFINSLHGSNGCFKNDKFSSIYTTCPSDKSTISSYYCVKVLEIFGSVASMGLSDFWEYMDSTYQTSEHFFAMREFIGLEEEMNLVASAMAVELSDLTWFSSYDRTATIQYVISHRNERGNWDDGTTRNNHDIWFTYAILRSLYNTGSLSMIPTLELDEIANSFNLYKNPIGGYSIVSKDYTSIKSLNSIVKSLKMENKYNNLALLEKEAIFNQITNACMLNYFPESMFGSQVNIALDCMYFKTFPTETNSYGNRKIFQAIGMPYSHKATYFALEILKNTFKLDDLDNLYSLLGFLQSIVDCQFLEPGYDGNGGFLPNGGLIWAPADVRDENVFLEYTYYGIKSLILIYNYLNLGSLSDSGIDCDSLTEFLYRNIVEEGGIAYFQPRYTDDKIEVLKNTYFALELLKILETYTLDDQKILSFAIQSLDYSSIASVYYCFKIFDLLGKDYDFDTSLIQDLVQQIYFEDINDFYLSTEKMEIEQEALFWICEMANSEWIRGEVSCEATIALGNTVNVSVSLSELIYDVIATDYTAIFESEQLGSFSLSASENYFWQQIVVPITIDNYPSVEGKIEVYEGGTVILSFPISFTTFCESIESFNALTISDGSVEFRASSKIIVENGSLASGPYGYRFFVDVYLNDDFIERIYLNETKTENANQTNYFLKYIPTEYGDYYYEMFYEDPFLDHPELVHTWTSSLYSEPSGALKGQEEEKKQVVLASTLSLGFLIAPFVIGGIFLKVKGDLRKRFPHKFKKSFKSKIKT
ncbi:MAG: hypothetical protein JW891_08095 [Candidatus Lokiarchaeota archaeon]|nr:hypothetical protein [Candidatus Lokiarchaeota archaeon]